MATCDVELVYHGARRVANVQVSIPKTQTMPDVLVYEGRLFVYRTDKIYMEAKCWKVPKDLAA